MNRALRNVDVVVVAGISGSGKTTLASALAKSLNLRFLEADDFHTCDAKQKMTNGIALTDQDRMPWLQHLNKELHKIKPTIIACSALTSQYREVLTQGLQAKFIWLAIAPELAEKRVQSRKNHFMPASLINSQLATAEQPADALLLQSSTQLSNLIEKAETYILHA